MTPNSGALPDSVDGFILRRTPRTWLPFVQLARLDRPAGWQLLLAPCWWSSALASVAAHAPPNLWHLLLFLVGAIAMRGAGCTYNDIIDRDIDAGVERTRGRPLPSGRVTLRAAKLFLVAQAIVGAAVLLSLNWFSVALGLCSLAIIAIYPFMKRITSWPQVVLGFAFAYGALMGWAAFFAALAAAPVLLYLAAICWTIGYDTIYALQDTRDDAIVGVLSTARLFGARARAGVAVFFALTVCLAVAAVGVAGGGVLSFIGVAAFAAHLAWQVVTMRPGDPARALSLFRANWHAGLLLFAGLGLDAMAAAR